MVRIYHNPRCSKSRATLQLVLDRGIQPQVIEYLDQPPDAATLGDVLAKLGLEARQLLRKGEPEYRDLGLADPSLTPDHLIQAMVNHPRLIERPIVVSDTGARIGRPPESVLEIL
ncbi:MAG: arsenate reductase (glutaredoxin) [Gammaproteobacteria bacterium]|jgi:arsenate reductase|nr:arsenate reductase (glutaredoxin) [Gammaproteobacteria bacterium]